jgi:choline dehydrogenase-like flavoprotein
VTVIPRNVGATGLRVIDASIMPTVVRANTHLTPAMIAEKMADALKSASRCNAVRFSGLD